MLPSLCVWGIGDRGESCCYRVARRRQGRLIKIHEHLAGMPDSLGNANAMAGV